MSSIVPAYIDSEIDDQLERTILDVGIPPCPEVLDRFMKEIRNFEPDFNRLEKIIATDVSVSAGLIKTANSSLFNLRQKVRSVREALAILGTKTAMLTVAGIILRNTFPKVPDLERFWDSSARIARVSGWLTQNIEINGIRPDDAYTYGLFRDCGIPVLLGRYKSYAEVLEVANNSLDQSFTDIEDTNISTNHAFIGWLLAQSWHLPKETCIAICNHHNIIAISSTNSRLPLPSRKLIAIAQLAEHLVQNQLGLSFTEEWTKLGNACLRLLNLEKEQLQSLYKEAESVLHQVE
jgi:HD-like signal output (HDOD) protein